MAITQTCGPITVEYPGGDGEPRKVTVTEKRYGEMVIGLTLINSTTGERRELACTADPDGPEHYGEHFGDPCPIHEPADR